MFLLNVAQTRAAEQAAAAAGISPQRLMENAGAAAAKAVAGFYTLPGLRAVVVAGNGNNGGDGFVVARKLKEYGAQVAVLLVMGMPATENSNLMLTRLRQANISVLNFYDDPTYAGQLISQADLLIDAIFGIGFHGAADRDLAAIIALMNFNFCVRFTQRRCLRHRRGARRGGSGCLHRYLYWRQAVPFYFSGCRLLRGA